MADREELIHPDGQGPILIGYPQIDPKHCQFFNHAERYPKTVFAKCKSRQDYSKERF